MVGQKFTVEGQLDDLDFKQNFAVLPGVFIHSGPKPL